ncbi:MAG: hypothetical protein V3T60_13655, partial [Candidatus Binatia bacterium]
MVAYPSTMDNIQEQDTSLTNPRNVTLLGSIACGHAVIHWFASGFPVLLAELVTSTGLGPLAAGTIMGARSISGAIASIP